MKYTADQFATALGLEKPVAYGALRFFSEKGMVTTEKADKVPGTRGKPAIIYTFNGETSEKFAAFVDSLGNLPTPVEPTVTEPVAEVAQPTEAPAEQPQA
jgi:hypothetical protein